MFKSVQDKTDQVGAAHRKDWSETLLKVQSEEVSVGEMEMLEVVTIHHRVETSVTQVTPNTGESQQRWAKFHTQSHLK